MMRTPLGYTLSNEIGEFKAGAVYIEIYNMSNIQNIYILFNGAEDANSIILEKGKIRIFPLLGSQGYSAFTITDGNGGDVKSVFVLIIN